jgi:NADH-quinone oxidoreductase subunit A
LTGGGAALPFARFFLPPPELPPLSGALLAKVTMLAEYSGVLIILALALTVAGGLLALHVAVGPKRKFAEKLEPFECGERQIVSPRQRFAVKFYLVAILFVVFDVEALFFYPWGALLGELGWYGYWAMVVFTVPLVVGLLYEWTKGALEW